MQKGDVVRIAREGHRFCGKSGVVLRKTGEEFRAPGRTETRCRWWYVELTPAPKTGRGTVLVPEIDLELIEEEEAA